MKCNDMDNIRRKIDREVEVYKQVIKELSPDDINRMGGFGALLDRVKVNIADSIAWSCREKGNA
jgi:hypothetical protein